MTLKDFVKIAWRITNDMYRRDWCKPDAVCVSRKIFDDLSQEAEMIVFAKHKDITPDAQICGLKLFVDDDMPDNYYQVGYADSFIEYFERKAKRIMGA